MLRSRLKYFVLPVTAVVAVACASASNTSAPKANGKQAALAEDPAHGLKVISAPAQEGVEHLKFKYGPIKIQPGQNNIVISGTESRSPRSTATSSASAPTSSATTASVPPVDVIHLHHGVWLNLGARRDDRFAELFFAAGEEKTRMILPDGLRLRVQDLEPWLLNYMLHNLTVRSRTRCGSPTTSTSSPRHRRGREDHQAGAPDLDGRAERPASIPCSTCSRAAGTTASTRTPTRPTTPTRRRRPRTSGRSTRDTVLIATAGHLHPGGLHDDLFARAPGPRPPPRPSRPSTVTRRTSSGPTPSTTSPRERCRGTSRCRRRPPTGGSRVKKGDMLSISGHVRHQARPRGTRSMGIMVVWMRRRHGRPRPVHEPRRRHGRAHPRAPARERQPRRRARPEALHRHDEAAVGAA